MTLKIFWACSLQTSDTFGHAVFFANGTVTDLNAPGTGTGDASANAINDNGVIVGTAVSNSTNQTFGFELTPVA